MARTRSYRGASPVLEEPPPPPPPRAVLLLRCRRHGRHTRLKALIWSCDGSTHEFFRKQRVAACMTLKHTYTADARRALRRGAVHWAMHATHTGTRTLWMMIGTEPPVATM